MATKLAEHARAASDIYGAPAAPVNRITVVNPKYEFPSIAPMMDIDTVHGLLGSAEAGSAWQLMILYRDMILSDPHLQGELSKRKLAVLGDTLNVRPFDKDNADDIAAAEIVKEVFGDVGGWLRNYGHLLDSTVYPVSVLEKVFAPRSATPGRQAGFYIKELVPVPHRLHDYSQGELRIYDTDENGMVLATSHEVDPNRYIVHRGHLLSSPDKFGGPMRSLIFWWLLINMDRGWWARYLDKYGGPFMVGKYNSGDEDSRRVLESAFSYAVRIGGLVVTKDTEVEIKDAASASSADGFQRFFEIGQREISKLILGQTLSAEARSTGMGSGVATLQAEVRDDIRLFDSIMLGSTIRDQLLKQYMAINNIAGNAPVISWGGISKASLAAVAELLASLKNAGIEVADDAFEVLSSMFGFNVQRSAAPVAPAPGDNPFSKLSALSAELIQSDDPIARAHAASLSRAMREGAAPLREMIALSTSAEDLEVRIRAGFDKLTPFEVSNLIDGALAAYARLGSKS